jgi:hypothetical protein
MYRSFSNALSLKKYEPATLGRETRQTITRQPREKVPVEERGAVTYGGPFAHLLCANKKHFSRNILLKTRKIGPFPLAQTSLISRKTFES